MSTQRSHQLYFRLLGFVRPYWPWFAAGISAMIVLALSEAGIPAVLKPVLDGTFVDKDPTFMAWAPLAIVGLFTVRGLAFFLSQLAFTAITTRVVFDLRKAMFDRLLTLPTPFYDQNASGRLISKVTYDVAQVTAAGTEVVTVLVKDSVTVLALLAYVFWLDWQLSLFTFVLGPTVAAIAVIAGRRMRRVSRRLQAGFGDMTHVLEEATRGHKVIKIAGAQDYERGRFAEVTNLVRRLQFKFKVAASAGVPMVEWIGSIILAAVIYIGTNRAEADQLTVGGFVAFFGAMALLFSPVKRLTKVNEPLQRGLAAAESIFGLLDEPPEQDSGSRVPTVIEGRIELQGIELRYPDSEQNALGPLDIAIEPRTTVALVGASGSGKTSLVNLVPRLYDPSSGRVLLDGLDLREWPLLELRRQIAYVGQDVVLFNDSVAANIAYGATVDGDAIRDAAEAAGALGFIEFLTDGFDTAVGENGVRLSGGQRQRLAIARALLKDAPVLILDEATSALDTESERHVQAALDRLRRGRTTLVIAHRLSTVEGADRILVMDAGRIVEDGTHAQLLARGGHYQTLYQHQFREPATS